MQSIERPGIDPKWAGMWKVVQREFEGYLADQDANNRAELESFVQHGDTVTQALYPTDAVTPPYAAWENSFLSTAMGIRALLALGHFEINSIKRGEWDLLYAGHAFAAEYTKQMASLVLHSRFPRRFAGRSLSSMRAPSILFTALGFVIGNTEHAERLARLQNLAYRKQYFNGQEYYPVYYFIMRLLADFLKEPMPRAEGHALSEPILSALFEVWRSPDPAAIAELCLGACDIHTRRCRGGGKMGMWFEFKDWKRTPVEILLLFKLRQKVGLANPVIDHPLMNTALGQLPEEALFEPDPLIAQVRARMVQEGYDEEALFEECYRA